MLAAVGRQATRGLLFLGEISLLIFQAFRESLTVFRRGVRPVFRVYLKQVYFTGVEALAIVVALFLIIAIVIITQIISFAGVGSAPLTGKVLAWIVVRELGPLLTAVIVIARSGAAIAAEMATMKLNGEIDVLDSLGIPPARYLILPRIFGVTTAILVLTLYAEVVAVAGGFLAASLGWGIPLEKYNQGIIPFLTLREIGVSFLKSLIFGLFVSATCCRQGLSVRESLTQVPQAATKGVMRSLLLVFLLDVVILAATRS
jgi:phospholipid/cholesterol/gamma-HCH transport system permease protein